MTEKELQQMKREEYNIRMLASRAIRESYPDVSEIAIRYKATSMCGEKRVVEGSRLYKPTDKDVFLIPCPNGTCTGIGFDLSSEVDNAIESKISPYTGTMKCDGYEDKERFDNYKCDSFVEFEIIVYRSRKSL